MKWYRLNPMYWLSKYIAFGIYSQRKDIGNTEKRLKGNIIKPKGERSG